MMNLFAFTLSTLALLKAATGASAVEPSDSHAAVRKNAGGIVKKSLFFTALDNEAVKPGPGVDDSDDFEECKRDCVYDQCSSVSREDINGRTCKAECRKRCYSNTHYSDFSSSFSFERPPEEMFDDCKQDCTADQCDDDDYGCKNECEKRCHINPNYSDFSNDVSASEDGNVALAPRRNLRKGLS